MSVVLALVACSGPTSGDVEPGDDDDDDDTVVDTEATGTTGETGAPITETGITGEPGVAGVVVGPDGEPISGLQILCCNVATCYVDDSAGDGSFWFPLTYEGDPIEIAMKTHEDLYLTPRHGAALEPVVFTGQHIDVGTLWVPDLPSGVRVGDPEDDPQTLRVGDGLELTVNRADLVPDLGVFLYDIAARRLPAEHVPPYPELGDETVWAVFAIHPFATTSASPIAIEVPCDLPAGTVVHVRAPDHLDGTMSAPATARCDGAVLTTDPGQGVTKLTHLVFSVP